MPIALGFFYRFATHVSVKNVAVSGGVAPLKKRKTRMEVFMNREQLRQMGLSDEQIDQIMTLHGSATQGLQAQLQTKENELILLREKENGPKQPPKGKGEIDNEGPESGKDNEEIIKLRQQVEALEKEKIRTDIKAYASEKGLSGDQAEKILAGFQDNLDVAKAAIDSMAQIISDRETAAAQAKEREISGKATNPGGGGTGGKDDTDALSNAEKLAKGMLEGAKQSQTDVLSFYTGGK